MKLTLASASPRRAELLGQVGWAFRVLPSDLSEELDKSLPVEQAVAQLALRKAKACPAEEGLIIGADTVVVLGEQILGKPESSVEAKNMLSALNGKTHRVVTGVGLFKPATGEAWAEAEVTKVKFRVLVYEEIEAYVRSGEPMDKAGAYGIQGKGALLIEGIEGCYFNVVGLPLARLAKMLSLAGYQDAYRF